jgi:hypothetical protein
MSIQLSVEERNARLDSIETILGASPLLRIFSGAMPASCVSADSGTKLIEITLGANWMSDAVGGQKEKSGTWTGTGLDDGVAGYFRIKTNNGSTCHIQGTVSITDGGGDMTLDNTNIATDQEITIDSFVLTDGNA